MEIFPPPHFLNLPSEHCASAEPLGNAEITNGASNEAIKQPNKEVQQPETKAKIRAAPTSPTSEGSLTATSHTTSSAASTAVCHHAKPTTQSDNNQGHKNKNNVNFCLFCFIITIAQCTFSLPPYQCTTTRLVVAYSNSFSQEKEED